MMDAGGLHTLLHCVAPFPTCVACTLPAASRPQTVAEAMPWWMIQLGSVSVTLHAALGTAVYGTPSIVHLHLHAVLSRLSAGAT